MQKDSSTLRAYLNARLRRGKAGVDTEAPPDHKRGVARRIWSVTIVICFLISLNTCVLAQSAPPSEYEIKAACLYNFAKLIEWPENAFENDDIPFFIGVLGEDPFGGALERVIQDRTIGERKIAIRRSSGHASCQLLFISSSESENISSVLKTIEGRHVVTVGEFDDFVDQGGVIELFIEDNKVRFSVNVDAAKRAGVTMDSDLLRLSTVVEKDTTDTTSQRPLE